MELDHLPPMVYGDPKTPVFRIVCAGNKIVDIDETRLRKQSPKVESRFQESLYEQNQPHNVPDVSATHATIVRAHVHNGILKLPGNSSKEDTIAIIGCLAAARWLGLDGLTHDVFQLVHKRMGSDKPFFGCMFDTVINMAKFNIKCTDVMFREIIDVAVHDTSSEFADFAGTEEGLEVYRRHPDYKNPQFAAALWEVLGRIAIREKLGGPRNPDRKIHAVDNSNPTISFVAASPSNGVNEVFWGENSDTDADDEDEDTSDEDADSDEAVAGSSDDEDSDEESDEDDDNDEDEDDEDDSADKGQKGGSGTNDTAPVTSNAD
ncbi:hypothetical protein H072_191 [Dactylellina haptotyla CBS 200.50]|uniref:BTB domain-containing protein n=1 Tax=Dactylellina haptotyla (strain CBS 200.50) TaxID=1284197 RepID=S8ASA4_DACHA|nr:hypothetical protein H072_191 [Dactylellina haptotyla CBS 200.50]